MGTSGSDGRHRTQLGYFWLPDDPEERLPGIVESDDTSILVRLLGMFQTDRRPVYSFPSDIGHDVVYADLQNPPQPYTLHGVNVTIPGGTYSVLRAAAGVEGAHNHSDALIKRVRYRIRGMQFVVPHHAVEERFYRDHQRLQAQFDVLRIPSITIKIPNGSTTIAIGTTIARSSEQSPTQIDVSHRVDVVLDTPIPWNELTTHAVLPLRHLVSLLRETRPAVTDVSFEAEGDEYDEHLTAVGDTDIHPRDKVPNLARGLEWPRWLAGCESPDYSGYESLTFQEIVRAAGDQGEFETSLAQWWAWASEPENLPVLQVANRTAAVEPRSAHDSFSDAVSALETYAYRFEPDRQAHAERVKRLVALVPDDDPDREWMANRLASGGGLGFLAKLARARDLHPAGRVLLGDDNELDQLAKARHKLGHGDYPTGYDLRDAARRIRSYLVVLALLTDRPTEEERRQQRPPGGSGAE